MPAQRLATLPAAPDLRLEQALWQSGRLHIAGLDEAGRGALAGPVAAGALILPTDPAVAQRLNGVRDSKQMSAAQRQYWAGQIKIVAVAWAVGFASPAEIDELGIAPATRLAMQRALAQLNLAPDYLLIDYVSLPEAGLPFTAYIKGDQASLSIAGAAVLAKTSRDEWMVALDADYPHYGFAAHKGYGVAAHLQALAQHGACPQHRRSFAPVSEWHPSGS